MTRLQHACGAVIGLRVVLGPTYYIGTWVDLLDHREIDACPKCGEPLRQAHAAGALRELPTPKPASAGGVTP